ncbi:unnamed protein product [Didymodactylos carnosus]|uniref:Uncharacterized protein n=1 Tax=Didymodactylos carnosus TaxID=1234261 RepID=A0A814N8U7_9BILA|nr:unnamed protein product [Didymodactylos carnosus]CAF1088914.1 unnamed protein product [Didymodactylos carnosus]CAF3817496.1 unnamed protein product [Didymodactylos carnosus]CAF3854520.1 unnamed protein product [Didymodactylos carnosus]
MTSNESRTVDNPIEFDDRMRNNSLDDQQCTNKPLDHHRENNEDLVDFHRGRDSSSLDQDEDHEQFARQVVRQSKDNGVELRL